MTGAPWHATYMIRFTVLLSITRPPVFLPLAIRSVRAQSVDSFELFIVCDGAPQATIDCAREHAARDPRIKVFVFDKCERNGDSHWHGVLAGASGECVAHLEDDDIWFPNHLEELGTLLQHADFGNLIHVWGKPDGSIEALPSNLALAEHRQQMLQGRYNRIGFSVCGYRLSAYRSLPEGWTASPRGVPPDLHMWRKFLRAGVRVETRMVPTAIVLASFLRNGMPMEERKREAHMWFDRVLDDGEREKIVQAAWRSIVDKALRLDHQMQQPARTP
jgi:hypothetical protein